MVFPKCAACSTSFKQWKGLRDHLLSGACPAPDKLKQLTEADAQGSAPERQQLATIRAELLELPQHQLCSYASRPAMILLNQRCLVCNFWTPDRTKVKSHFRQAHPGDVMSPTSPDHKQSAAPSCRAQPLTQQTLPKLVCSRHALSTLPRTWVFTTQQLRRHFLLASWSCDRLPSSPAYALVCLAGTKSDCSRQYRFQ